MAQSIPVGTPTPLLTEVLFRVFAAMNCAAVLLDRQKRVVHLNGRARRCLNDSLILNNDRLCATDRTCDPLLQAILDEHLNAHDGRSPGRNEALGLKRVDKRPVIARVVSVSSEAQVAFGGAALLVILLDPEDCPVPSNLMLQQVFGLTKGEARVATRLLCGDSLQDIADTFGVGVGTVRSQVKAAFSKTHTNRQAELVALLTRLAMISEEDGEA